MKLPLHIYTLCLDGIRFLPKQLEVFEQLKIPWTWHIVSGVADSVKDTDWVARIQPRFSRDGTDEWLNSKLDHPNIRIYRRQLWSGKNAMVNAALIAIKEECALMEIDADEFWTAEQLEKIVSIYETGACDRMRFYCRYFVGKNIVVTGENVWSNKNGEWSRSWLFKPGMMQAKHEPPILQGCGIRELAREHSREHGLVFDHFAYCFPEQLQFKEVYYKYANALAHWDRLQQNTQWPVKPLKAFLPWSGDDACADLFEHVYPAEKNPTDKFTSK